MSRFTVALAPERFAQLRRLADLDGKSLSDTIADFLNDAIRAGRLPDELPGWNVERHGDNIMFANPEAGLTKRWPIDVALGVAKSLEELSHRGGSARGRQDWNARLELHRQGRGVKLIDLDTGASATAAFNVAEDLAAILRKAAA
ncbi:MAG TPA: hypothetical protein VGN97_01040 [Mesorhizobium sp.]|jgi:hypothetical protein|nr:hypothetical protein [Mesorhizobium sp.]